MKVVSRSLEETEKIAQDFLGSVAKKSDEAFVVGLYGDLGSGKTTFTQAIARELGITEDITSPTYVIEKIYQIPKNNFKQLVHIDAYRLDSSHELAALDWEQTKNNSENLILIEWPERVADILPQNHPTVRFAFVNENEREIEF